MKSCGRSQSTLLTAKLLRSLPGRLIKALLSLCTIYKYCRGKARPQFAIDHQMASSVLAGDNRQPNKATVCHSISSSSPRNASGGSTIGHLAGALKIS